VSTTVADYIAEVMERPEVKQARRKVERDAARARERRRNREAAEAPFVQRPLEHFAVKGTWTAAEVEPFLAPPRSSLNPAFILGDEDL
jgi:hypothetical protein